MEESEILEAVSEAQDESHLLGQKLGFMKAITNLQSLNMGWNSREVDVAISYLIETYTSLFNESLELEEATDQSHN